MRITKEQGIKIKKAILDRGYSITGFCRIHNISDRQFYTWLAGTNGYERNGIGKHFHDITDVLLADKVAEDVAKEKEQKQEAATEIKDEYIASLEAENANLKADNRSLVEQMNKMAMRMEHKSGTTQRRKA